MAQTEKLTDPEAIAEAALAKMVTLRLRPDPSHFTVWYRYFGDAFPDLTKTVDQILDGGGMSNEQCTDLFVNFFTTEAESAKMEDFSVRLDEVMDQAVRYLDEAGAEAAEFGETLAGASEGLSGTEPDATAILRDVLSATRDMQARQKSMENKLIQSSGEIGRLREEVEETRREATTDGLTGLANRRLFDLRVREDMSRAADTEEDLCLLMLDIDHFKKFNDSFGHLIGDHVLKLLATILRAGLKGKDLAARYGGEEFGVLLPQTNLQNAVKVAEGIRVQLSKKKVVNRSTGQDLGKITLSVGLSRFRPREQADEFIERADMSLYAAKKSGRNKVLYEADLECLAKAANS